MNVQPSSPPRLAWQRVFLLAASCGAYIVLFYVRTLQARVWFGDVIDMDPVAAFMRPIGIFASASPDALRWLSYGLFGLIAGLYLLALWAVAQQKLDNKERLRRQYLRWVIVPYVLFGLLSLLLYPHYSRPVDTVDYTMQARILVVHNENPYLVPGDVFIERDGLAQNMEAKHHTSIYGPAWLIVSILPSIIANGQLLTSIIAMKAWSFFAGLLCLCLILLYYKQTTLRLTLTHSSLALRGAVLLAWNPTLHLISHGEGHNDIWMAVFLAAALALFAYQRWLLAFLAWALSVLVKFISAPFGIALVVATYAAQASVQRTARMRLIIAGLVLSALLAAALIVPFGPAAVFASVSGRYGGLLASGGDSKISLAAGLLARVLGRVGIESSAAAIAPIVGLLLPLGWLLYGLLRSLWARDAERLAKVGVESFLIYLTFVAIPVYAQYTLPAVVLAAFLATGKWHRLAALLVSLALTWDSLFLVYLPPAYPAWEGYVHQLSHVILVFVVLLWLVAWLRARWISRARAALVTQSNASQEGL